jgi:hypothetical protein
MKTQKENKRTMAMKFAFIAIFLFLSVSLYAEYRELGPGEFLGVKSFSTGAVTNESWTTEVFDGSISHKLYYWDFYHRDSAMLMMNVLTEVILKDKSLFFTDKWEDKNQIVRRSQTPFVIYGYICDNGVIAIAIIDRNTGKSERWIFK